MSYKLNWKGVLLWSNQFYGICAVVLSIASTQLITHHFPSISLLLLIHFSTVLYYTHAYIVEQRHSVYNERSIWYHKHIRYLRIRQVVYTLICIYLGIFELHLLSFIVNAPIIVIIALLIMTYFSSSYYVSDKLNNYISSYRGKGILKSIGIAFVWTMTCVLIPIWLTNPLQSININLLNAFWLYFFQVFIFILMLAILFDIKDLHRDKEQLVNTIVVKYGYKNTIRFIIIPLLLVYGIFTFLLFLQLELKVNYLFSEMLMIASVYLIGQLLVKRQNIAENILLIDGLIILKGLLTLAHAYKLT